MLKVYPGLDEQENLQVNLNKICRSEKFKMYITSRLKFCPSDLTIIAGERSFYPDIRHYGFDHSCNNGTEYTDLSDYYENFSDPEISDSLYSECKNYFKDNEPELWSIMKDKF